jgi:hypothetical protein
MIWTPNEFAGANSETPNHAFVHLVPISFPLGSDGLAGLTFLRLSLRFRLSEGFMFIDEDVYDVLSGDLVQTIG